MSDIEAARAKQLRNIEARTGKSIADIYKMIANSGFAKVGEQRSWLMEKLGLGYGDANTLALCAKENANNVGASSDDPLDEIYIGSKAHLRPLHERVMRAIAKIGPHEQAPKRTYISLRRKKQFAMLGPATKDALELGLNAKQLVPTSRLKALPPGRMCQYSVRLSSVAEIDAELLVWVHAAYAAAG